MWRYSLCLIFGLVILVAPGQPIAEPQDVAQVPVRVVVVTMFGSPRDTGDRPGELQRWVEGLPLTEVLPFPVGWQDLHYNPDKQVLVVTTGIGSISTTASIMALGLDPRFDLRKAYWLVAGIAGANPAKAPLGSAVWADWVVDGDLAQEIDAREIPEDWPTGYLPLRASRPYQEPQPRRHSGTSYRLNEGLVDWAYDLTKDMVLPDPPGLAAWRANYREFDAARQAPRVMRGDTLSAMTFWHGRLLNDWATDWVAYWSDGAGSFATSNMEDTGTLGALAALERAGKADLQRVLVLRATSNFTMQHAGVTAAESLATEGRQFSARLAALDAAYAVGSRVVEALLADWPRFAAAPPQAN
jgi:purine nucleoside permease